MASTIETLMWTKVEGDLVLIEFLRGEHHYVFASTPKTLPQVLMLIDDCAKDESQVFTQKDASQVIKSMMQLCKPIVPQWNYTHAIRIEEPVIHEEGNIVAGIGWLMVGAAIFWGLVGCLCYMWAR